MAMPNRLRVCIRVWILPVTIEMRDKRYLLTYLFSMLLELKLALEIELAAAKYWRLDVYLCLCHMRLCRFRPL